MSAIKRVVSTAFWEDDKVIDNFTPEDKYFMLYLLTNPHTKQIGIYPLNVRQASFEMGYSKESIENLLDRFENLHQIIKRSKKTSEIAIKNYLCYSVVKGGQPVMDCLEKELQTIKDKSLVNYVFGNLKNRNDLLNTVKSFVEKNFDAYNNNDIDNDNDNDNDSTCHVREPYAKENKSNRFVKPTVEEIEQHINEKGYDINAQYFFDYYEAVNWYRGKTKIKDWKKVLATWNSKNKKNNPTNHDGDEFDEFEAIWNGK